MEIIHPKDEKILKVEQLIGPSDQETKDICRSENNKISDENENTVKEEPSRCTVNFTNQPNSPRVCSENASKDQTLLPETHHSTEDKTERFHVHDSRTPPMSVSSHSYSPTLAKEGLPERYTLDRMPLSQRAPPPLVLASAISLGRTNLLSEPRHPVGGLLPPPFSSQLPTSLGGIPAGLQPPTAAQTLYGWHLNHTSPKLDLLGLTSL